MNLTHYVLDTPTLLGLGGNKQLSGLIHRAYAEPDARLWVPLLSLVEAEREKPGIIEHIGQLEVLHTLDLDYAGTYGVMSLHREGVPLGVAAAIHGARNLLLDPENDALVATVALEAYQGSGVRIFDLNR
ncbi:hypothetical protein NLX86_26130 [Streptomyces sp. A3M-1-3]|uniref:hypothetical protein n=1 Tax=Streptomyces sp. A3M-1-3 TaxID=2962044 RepID=UPI0020B6D685|nr:hypothetical protein [Streptomyces sp. A3M-1-3]MCP3821445.1 hypothetical protein [Streptomyces sp. A3M-1-3]